MCKCTPEIKTPFCGKPGCEWPPQKERQTPQTSNQRLLLREDGKPYSPGMELSWKTFLGNRGAMSPDFWEVARIAYIAAWHASLTYARRDADETPKDPIPHHVRYDRLGWVCSMCGGWNDAADGVTCRFKHDSPVETEARYCPNCGERTDTYPDGTYHKCANATSAPAETFRQGINRVRRELRELQQPAGPTPDQIRAYALAHDDPDLFNSVGKAPEQLYGLRPLCICDNALTNQNPACPIHGSFENGKPNPL